MTTVKNELRPVWKTIQFRVKTILISLVGLFLLAFSFYSFMTTDRHGYVKKEFETGVKSVVKEVNYQLYSREDIQINQIPLAPIKLIRLFLRRQLNKYDLMFYGYEQGKQFTIYSIDKSTKVICKALFAGDHLMALTIEYKKENDISNLKLALQKEFKGYKILYVSKEAMP